MIPVIQLTQCLSLFLKYKQVLTPSLGSGIYYGMDTFPEILAIGTCLKAVSSGLNASVLTRAKLTQL